MRREAVVLVVGVTCLLALAGLAGGMVDSAGSPAVELPQVVEDVMTIPDRTANAEDLESIGGERRDPGWLAWAPPVLFGAWILGATRYMSAAAAVFSLIAGGLLVVMYHMVTFGGPGVGRTFAVAAEEPALLDRIVGILLLLVVLVTGVLVLEPRRIFRGTDVPAVGRLQSRLDALLGRFESEAETEAGADWTPDNEVYRAWQEFVDRVGETEDTSPGEAARVARDAGLPPEAVDTVRETFEEVRYGHASVTASRIQRVERAIARLDANSAPAGEGRPDAAADSPASTERDGR